VAGQGFLHAGGQVLDQRQAVLGAQEARHPAGMRHERGRGEILVMGIERFNHDDLRLMRPDRVLQSIIHLLQPPREPLAARRADRARGDQAHPIA
jgi:hypothetical protein